VTTPKTLEQLLELIVADRPLERSALTDLVDLDEVGLRGRTLLMAAAFRDNIEAFEVLVQCGASIHRRGGSELTALHEASANGSEKVARRLLELGADVDAVTVHLVTPLMCAAAWGHSTIAKLLLDGGADVKKMDCYGATALDIASEKGQEQVAQLIASHGK
jgi:uncharacterized protein